MDHHKKSLSQLFGFGRVLMIALFAFLLVGWFWTGLSLNPVTAVTYDYFEDEFDTQELAEEWLDELDFEERQQVIENVTALASGSHQVAFNLLVVLEVVSLLAALAIPLVFERFFASPGTARLFGTGAWIWLRIAAILLAVIAATQITSAVVGVSLDPFFALSQDWSEYVAYIVYESSAAVPILIIAFGLEVMARLVHVAAELETETAMTI